MSRQDALIDLEDMRIRELQQRVRTVQPHRPKPGDPDYLTPEQVARIKAEREVDDCC